MGVSDTRYSAAAALIARFGIVRLNNRLDQNYVGVGNGLFHVFGLREVQAVGIKFGLVLNKVDYHFGVFAAVSFEEVRAIIHDKLRVG